MLRSAVTFSGCGCRLGGDRFDRVWAGPSAGDGGFINGGGIIVQVGRAASGGLSAPLTSRGRRAAALVSVCCLAVVTACASSTPAVLSDASTPRPTPPLDRPVDVGDDPVLEGSGRSAIPPGDEAAPTTTLGSSTGGPLRVLALRTPSGVIVPVRSGGPGEWVVGTPCFEEVEIADGEPIGAVRVVIDAGHGGADEPGAVGPNGLTEADLNLDVAERVVSALAEAGISAALTRTADYRMAIVARAELAVALAPEIFISIHHNGGPVTESAVPGTEIFHQVGSDDSERLGGLLFEEITAAFGPFGDRWAASEFQGVLARMNADGDDLYGVLRRTTDVVSVLTEALYLSEPAEAELLATSGVVQAEAEAIVRAVIRYFETDERGRGHLDDHTFVGRLGGGGGTAGCDDPDLE